MCAVRGPVAAVNEKVTTPSLCPVMVSHSESLTAVKFVVVGNTGGSWSDPAPAVSTTAVVFTKTGVNSWISAEGVST